MPLEASVNLACNIPVISYWPLTQVLSGDKKTAAVAKLVAKRSEDGVLEVS